MPVPEYLPQPSWGDWLLQIARTVNADEAVLNTATGAVRSYYAAGHTTGQSSSTTFGQGSLSFDALGIASMGFSAGSIIVSASSATSMGLSALGNTTAASSSSTLPLTAQAISFAGAVSGGMSVGTLVISGGTQGQGFALGNTTGGSSSSTVTLSQFSISGAGGVSVGWSTTGPGAGVLVVSGATTGTGGGLTSMGQTAVGNTIGATSSQTRAISIETISGANGASVGFSNGTLIISAPGSSAALTALTSSYYDVVPLQPGSAQSFTTGIMRVVPMMIQAGALTWDRAHIFGVRSVVAGTLNVSTAAGVSDTATASGGWNSTISIVLYTQGNSTSFGSSAQGTMSFGLTQSWSVSRTAGSNSVTMSATFSWAIGSSTGGGLSTTTRSSSTNVSSAYTFAIPQLVNASGSIRNDIPWQSSIGPGQYLMGYIGLSATATGTGATHLAVSAGNWSQNVVCAVISSGRWKTTPDDTVGTYDLFRWGGATTAGNGVPASINWLALNGSFLASENNVSAPLIALACFGTG